MEVGLIQKIDIDQEMQQSYLDYSMSVIVSRALPDARDGLKPVHRRILYAMYDMGLRTDSAYKKSARIVGEVMGKYHPHGDLPVYEAMARMAQDFSMRYLLVNGQGNFGSVDGDPPAAMRYTEARLAPPAMRMLEDITKNTVDFSGNFDDTLTEPSVLPSAIPNLLINGASGIAVGMATSIPPHNLGEIIDAIQFMLKNWDRLDDISIEDLMRYVQGPDFPTGGVIIAQTTTGESLTSAYSTGRGQVLVQARAHLEEMERGRNRIIITELPFMTNKSSLIERIAELVRESRLEGIVDLRDESDRQGMRIVIEVGKSTNPENLLHQLYKLTPMQSTFSINMLALVEGEPRLLSLKQALRVYTEHRLEIVRRRSEYDLEMGRERAHILEGYRVALKNLDELISLIRKSPDVETARTRIIKRYRLTQIQAQAILDMPLRRLAALERKKIEDEYKEVRLLIKELEALLRSGKKMRQVVSNELDASKETYGDRRRTHIVSLKEGKSRKTLLSTTEIVPEKSIWLAVTSDGLISSILEEKAPHLSGRDAPSWLIKANSREILYLVCDNGETAAIPVHAVPEADNPLNGISIAKVAPFRDDHRLASIFTLPTRTGIGQSIHILDDYFILTVSCQGYVKKSSLNELPGASANVFNLARINQGDRLGWLQFTNGNNEILLVTRNGCAIRFNEDEVRSMGLFSAGVLGIKLQAHDEIAGTVIPTKQGEVFLITNNGRAKRISIEQFPTQGRYGQGVVAWKLPSNEKIIGVASGKGSTRGTLLMKKLLPKVIRLDEAPIQGRNATRGKIIQEVNPGDQVLKLSIPWEVSLPISRKKGEI